MLTRTVPFTGSTGSMGALGAEAAIRPSEIRAELNQRGYTVQVAAEPVVHVPHVVFTLSRAQAIMIAVDSAIEGYNLPRGYTHPFTCPMAACPVEPATWNAMIPWAVDAANGLLDGRYGLPPWFKTMMDIDGIAGVGGTGTYGLGGFMEWLQENAILVSAIGAALTIYGQYLTTKQAKEAIQASIPKDYLTKANMPALVSELQKQGFILPGKIETVSAGAMAATTPEWLWPVVIGGGVLVVVMMMMKR